MNDGQKINEYITSLTSNRVLGGQVVDHRVIEPSAATFGMTRKPWPPAVQFLLEAIGINRLYEHQVQALDRIRAGSHTVVSTQTASGKTLTYTLPVFESVIDDPSACAMLIYPLKALAQDQRKTIARLAAHLSHIESADIQMSVEIYDGDTTSYRRKKIRDNPPSMLMTNPEMIHLSILPHHERWADLLGRLRYVVVDEVHTYRGILGSHMAQVFRRLLRMCSFYGSTPTFVFTSATVANPDQLANQLTGLSVETIDRSTAGAGLRHWVLLDPVDGPLRATVTLLMAALHRGLRTIVYTQSRKLAELLAIWAKNRAGEFAPRISAYRAGFLPEERREIESKLASGELLAVITTSALELGIDIGSLDLCLLVGYPGSIVATLQRSGRVGRSGQESAVVMVAGEDALDQYFIKNPDQLVLRPPEAAVINPFNPDVMSRHLVCAAAELPLAVTDPMLASKTVAEQIEKLVGSGELFLTADGTTFVSPLKNPHRHVDLRGTGTRFAILDQTDNRQLGEIDGFRALREVHPGAIYLHRGKTFLVGSLEPETKKAYVSPARVHYHTRVRSHKNTEILEITDQKGVFRTRMAVGRLRVTEQVTGFDRIETRTGKVIGRTELDLPPLVFETQGIWFSVPEEACALARHRQLHVMGGLHAVEHGAIGVFPLLVLADRNDLGGISTPFHPQLAGAGIFIYDGIPGGAGLCAQAFSKAQELFSATLSAISGCPCETGCPSCVHSPKCGSGNRPIDKAAAIFLLRCLMTDKSLPISAPFADPMAADTLNEPLNSLTRGNMPEGADLHYGVLDIETQRSAQEVGGWHKAERMGVSCAVLYDSRTESFFEFVEGQIPILLSHLRELDLVVGFNIKRFDYRVLSAYADMDFGKLPTLDLLEKVKDRLGYRLSLDHLASTTLNAGKTADGLAALRWWKEGKMAKILEYCRSDVAITRDLYRFGKENRYLLFTNKAKQVVRLPVDW